jgi:hypothetical protein
MYTSLRSKPVKNSFTSSVVARNGRPLSLSTGDLAKAVLLAQSEEGAACCWLEQTSGDILIGKPTVIAVKAPTAVNHIHRVTSSFW